MLDHLVRPLVRTQIQLLTQTQAATPKLMGMITRWLGYLGIQAHVSHLRAGEGKVQISLAVEKPEQCDSQEWQQILDNIAQTHSGHAQERELTYADMPRPQQRKVSRLLACVIQGGNPETALDSEGLHQRLLTMGMEPALALEIKSAVRVPGTVEPHLEDLEPETAAFVLSRAIGIALIDHQISPQEDHTLKSIYGALEQKTKTSCPDS